MKNLFQKIIQCVGPRFVLFTMFVSITTVVPSWAEETLTVTVREDQTLRDIAKEYLGNPNLWVDILRTNNLTSASDIKVGMSLKIPATALMRTNRALRDALSVIDKATMAGARLFAPDIITEAIEKRNQAIAKRNTGRYDLSYTLARESKVKAREALRICIANQNVPAEAIINYRKGSVQHRGPDVRIWNSASLNTILIEGERVRTLSESYAGILFRDESRLRLEENSLALIQKMRSNKLANTEDSSITLLEGDLSAFLGGSRKGDNFRLQIPDIETKIRSSHFWVSRDKKATRFSNYDGELEISTGDDSLVIRKNQGSVVGRKQKKLELQKLLPRTNLISPPTSADVLDGRLILEWEPVEGARSYWLEISNDKSFNRVVFSKKTLTSTRYVRQKAPQAVYYWRVAAVDRFGLPGTKSEVRMLKVLKDAIPPYLLIKAPPQDSVVRDGIITLVGESELGATVLVEGDALKLDPKGGFRAFVPLSLGLNAISVDARDNAGNVTRQKLTITYLPDTELGVFNFDGSMNQISPNHFVIQGKGFILVGKTVKDSSIGLKSIQSPYKANTYADKSGFFHLSVPLSRPKEEFIFTRRIPSGQITEERLVVEIRARQPVIELTTPLPKVTTKKKFTLSGRVRYGTALRINGREVLLIKGAFKKTVELKPGSNYIRLEARDAVKNVTIVEKELVLDQQAPSLQRVELSKKKVKGGELLRIEVYAKDSSRMKRAAPYTVEVSSFVYDGFLILSRSKGVFVGNVRLPKNVSGTVKVTKVLLEDYYGNRKEYVF
jgi:LysM repeat protein